RGPGRRNEFAVGAVILAVIAVLFFGVRYLENRPLFAGDYTIYTEFEMAEGLLPGSTVTVSGVRVGEVEGVRLLSPGHAVRVRMRISDEVQIPQGSVAVVEGIAALDNVKVAIRSGAPTAPPVEEGAVLPSMQVPGLIDLADSTLAGADQTFNRAEALLANTDRDLAVVLTNMQIASGEAARLLRNERQRMQSTVADLRSAASSLDHFAAEIDRLALESGDSLGIAVNRLNAMLQRLDVVVGSMERGSADMERMFAAVNEGRGTLGRFVHDPTLYTRLDSAALHLDQLLLDFKRDPGRYLGTMDLIDIF
ncbi:MAG: MlaD family protein, partial [Rhodothermales bacterium]